MTKGPEPSHTFNGAPLVGLLSSSILAVIWASAAVARSITALDRQAQALAQAAAALVSSGRYQEAERAAMQAETVARSVTDPHRQARALAEVATVQARTGQYQEAEAAARSITSPDRKVQVLAETAQALAGAGQYEQAVAWKSETAARAIPRSGPADTGPGTGGCGTSQRRGVSAGRLVNGV
jgi:hypothetical protein